MKQCFSDELLHAGVVPAGGVSVRPCLAPPCVSVRPLRPAALLVLPRSEIIFVYRKGLHCGIDLGDILMYFDL